jgi:magnesium chelatase family protein
MIRSVAGELAGGRLTNRRPFRAPHHSASMAALVGGGPRPRPGEIALAHHGVLFLDELPEFSAQALDALRQPLESGEAAIARANHRISYPARFQLIAAMNPCRCGGGEGGHACRRGPRCAAEYQSRISGPLLDRIDLRLDVPAVSASDLMAPANSEDSATVAARVAAARRRQAERHAGLSGGGSSLNAHVPAAALEEIARTDTAGRRLLLDAAEGLRLSARGYHRTLRVARTIADLDGVDTVGRIHLAEALAYRGASPPEARAA